MEVSSSIEIGTEITRTRSE